MLSTQKKEYFIELLTTDIEKIFNEKDILSLEGRNMSDFILLEGRYNNISSMQRRGVLSFNDYDLELNRIRDGLLKIIDKHFDERLNEDNFRKSFVKKYYIHGTVLLCLFIAIYAFFYLTQSKPILRNTPMLIIRDSMNNMIKEYDFFCTKNTGLTKWSNINGKGFLNDFKIENKGLVIFDKKSGLRWQQSGSNYDMEFVIVQAYVDSLNNFKFGNLERWRLPTMEEAMTLLEPKRNNNGNFIDNLFDQKQNVIWTADTGEHGTRWILIIKNGFCLPVDISSKAFLRLVYSD